MSVIHLQMLQVASIYLFPSLLKSRRRGRECTLKHIAGGEERAGDGQLIDLPQVIRESREGKQEQQRLFIVIVNQGEEERFNNILLLLFLGNQHSV